MNANTIFKWLCDARIGSEPEVLEDQATEAACLLPVDTVDRPRRDDPASRPDPMTRCRAIEIDIADGHCPHSGLAGLTPAEKINRPKMTTNLNRANRIFRTFQGGASLSCFALQEIY